MIDDDDGDFPTCKVILIGESGVGKSDIMPMIPKPSLGAPLGSNFLAKTMQIDANQFIKFEIWDTAGQKQFRSLAKIFYKNAGAVIMVYDITKKSSFNALKDYWITEIKKNTGKDVGKYINI